MCTHFALQGIHSEALSLSGVTLWVRLPYRRQYFETFQKITEDYGLISLSAPVVTEKGSNMVSGLRDSPRLDFICHRLHTFFTDAYIETQRQVPEVKKYEEAAATLCKYVKQATGIQETLPVSVKHGGTTGPWTSIYRLVHSIHES